MIKALVFLALLATGLGLAGLLEMMSGRRRFVAMLGSLLLWVTLIAVAELKWGPLI
jgi:hypothetical protein